MSQALQTAIDELVSQIAAKEAEIAPLKIAVNTLCRTIGATDRYSDVTSNILASSTTASVSAGRPLSWSPSQFYGRPLATCVAEIMEARVAAGHDKACSIDDIFPALKEGGFRFEGATGNEANTKRAIKISLTKNTYLFVKLPNELFSLKKWFAGGGGRLGKRPSARRDSNGGAEHEDLDEGTDDAEDAAGDLPLLANGTENPHADVLK